MANGTITLDTPKSTVAGYIKWTSEASSATNNYSLVSAYVYLKKTDGYTSWGDFSGKLTINGTSYSFSKKCDFRFLLCADDLEDGGQGESRQ